MSLTLPHQPRLLTVVLLDAGQFLSRTTVVFDASRLWLSVGTTSECDIIVTEPDFPQLAFQINWHPNREPLLYVHPAAVWLDGQHRQATLTESIFPLGMRTAVCLHGTRTVFLVLRTDAAGFDGQAWASTVKGLFPDPAADRFQPAGTASRAVHP
ncbi:hypothetical protein J8C02_13165 [Chloracidobacterium sp. MS 40/45]|uniref:hypothetical protein n=1 Tax=Chloracidobacterium aggregatum TaxID=2851959 RepID=UPI001B8BEDE0|nr:hypothetical protein [Chloracidobacterium aggregatum]QUW01099.1 hypothetical protein J8C02_13165 [Chloracidobacterium sp. MS 40/45]